MYEVCRPLYGNPSSPRALHKTLGAYFMSKGFEHVGFEESVWVRSKGGKYGEWPRQVVEMRRSAECGRCADQKPSASSPFQAQAIHVGHTYSFFSFLSLSQGWTAPDGVLQYHHTMRIPSRTRRLGNISSVCALVCMCVLCVNMTRDAMIDTGGERNKV